MRRELSRLALVEFGAGDAYFNMALDRYLFDMCESRPEHGYLRFYTWLQPALSLGLHEPTDAVDAVRCARDGVVVVRRPTGGRMVLHGDDLTYAVVMPGQGFRGLLHAYREISTCLTAGLARLGLSLVLEKGGLIRPGSQRGPCFASASRFEITDRGRKIAGSAQKIGANAILQHGSIPLGYGYMKVSDYVAADDRERSSIREHLARRTCCLESLLGTGVKAGEVAGYLAEAFLDRFGYNGRTLALSDFRRPIGPLAAGLREEALQPKPQGTKALDTASRAFI